MEKNNFVHSRHRAGIHSRAPVVYAMSYVTMPYSDNKTGRKDSSWIVQYLRAPTRVTGRAFPERRKLFSGNHN
jgi:hypothetical protein